MEFAGIAMAVLMVAGFVIGVIQQVKREMEKSRAKGPRVGNIRPARKSTRYRALSGRNLNR